MQRDSLARKQGLLVASADLDGHWEPHAALVYRRELLRLVGRAASVDDGHFVCGVLHRTRGPLERLADAGLVGHGCRTFLCG